ncbi:MAG: TldD/PmbA family protein [Candidatus Krumholzibacteriota bacterium]|nr:TldD/PmbA family protein [Candidatus Krumholzibacteriota bacterium]
MIELPVRGDIQDALESLVDGGAEFAELFFESRIIHSIRCEEKRIDRISSGRDIGFGLRVMTGGRTAYGYSNNLTKDEIFRLGRAVLKDLEDGNGSIRRFGDTVIGRCEGISIPSEDVSIEEKIEMILLSDRIARGVSEEISQVRVNYSDMVQNVRIFNSEGVAVGDDRRQIVYNIRAVAADGTDIQSAYRSAGGRKGFEFLDREMVSALAVESAESAVRTLHAERAPAGVMTVILAGESGGTMVHEAIGHGLEGDAAEKGLSIYSGKKGEKVASELITVIDDPTLQGARGSYNFDDEGVRSRRNVPVENGVLKSYLLDRRIARKEGTESTGNGRREDFRHRPIVRMSNTMIAEGDHAPEEIIGSVEKGLYVVRMGGGQVDTSSGDFVFKVNEAFLIEKGKIASPVRGATLIGNGPAVLSDIDMVGNDLGFDIGTCGKDGQQVPVSDAQPTLRIPAITVGGEV